MHYGTPNLSHHVSRQGFSSLTAGTLLCLDPFFNISSDKEIRGMRLVIQKFDDLIRAWNFEINCVEVMDEERLMKSTYMILSRSEEVASEAKSR